jgi:hypothetical protein
LAGDLFVEPEGTGRLHCGLSMMNKNRKAALRPSDRNEPPPAGPHGKPELIAPDNAPGTGILPETTIR